MPTNWKQLKAIEAKNKKRILEICPSANDESGIYVFLRYEGEFKYAYIGQAKHLLTRLAQHLNGYQHIDLSIKRHGLYSEENPTGWQVVCANYPEDALDDTERQLIATYANKGYQLRNKTAGGQDSGKFGIDDNRPAKGYYDGLQQGYENARKEVKHLFDLHLVAAIKANKPNKTQEKALKKFYDFINGGMTETYYSEKGKMEGVPSELADVVIRVMDLAEYYGIDLEKTIAEKHAFNKTRPFKHGGKKL